MKTYIKGNFRKSIFKSEKGYVIGLFKVRETNSETLEEYINKTITFTGFFHELYDDDTYLFYGIFFMQTFFKCLYSQIYECLKKLFRIYIPGKRTYLPLDYFKWSFFLLIFIGSIVYVLIHL